MKSEFIVEREDQLSAPLSYLLTLFPAKNIVLLEGDLGSGKTTFVKHLADLLGSTDEVSSPTFAIAQFYDLPEGPYGFDKLWHLDLYRLETLDEAINAGVEEILFEKAIICIEWPEILGVSILPENQVIRIKIDTTEDATRKILFL